MYYRVNPLLDEHSKRPVGADMFRLAEVADTRVVNGSHWGQDFIIAPKKESEKEAFESLMSELGIFFEKVEELPYGLKHLE